MKASFRHLVAAGALVATAGACSVEPDIAEPFKPAGTGSVSGQVFLDLNDNRQFEPVLGDSLVTRGTVELSERGDSARVVATGTLGAEGRFTITNVPVGSYDLRAYPEGGQGVTCAPVTATVFIGEMAFAETPVRVSCRLDVEVAKRRARPAVVTVAGIVTAAPGTFRSDNLYLQDATGGIQAFAVPGNLGAAVGDSIELTGRLDFFRGELQLNSPYPSARVVQAGAVAPGTGVLDPAERTIAEIFEEITDLAAQDSTAEFMPSLGALIVVRGVRFVGLPAANSTGSGTDLTISQGTDELRVRLDQAVNSTVNVTTLAGDRCFDVAGILGFFSPNPQLKPRGPADITEVTCPTR